MKTDDFRQLRSRQHRAEAIQGLQFFILALMILGTTCRWTELWLLPPAGGALELDISSFAFEASRWPCGPR